MGHEGTGLSDVLSGRDTPVSIGLIAASEVPSIEMHAISSLGGLGAIGSAKRV
jgi:hypothetical protein